MLFDRSSSLTVLFFLPKRPFATEKNIAEAVRFLYLHLHLFIYSCFSLLNSFRVGLIFSQFLYMNKRIFFFSPPSVCVRARTSRFPWTIVSDWPTNEKPGFTHLSYKLKLKKKFRCVSFSLYSACLRVSSSSSSVYSIPSRWDSPSAQKPPPKSEHIYCIYILCKLHRVLYITV